MARVPARASARKNAPAPSGPTEAQSAILEELRAAHQRLAELADRARRCGLYRRRLPETALARYLNLTFWHADKLCRELRDHDDAVLTLEWHEPSGAPVLVLQRRARVIELAPYLAARRPRR